MCNQAYKIDKFKDDYSYEKYLLHKDTWLGKDSPVSISIQNSGITACLIDAKHYKQVKCD